MSKRLNACVGADFLCILLSVVPFGFAAAKVGLCSWYLNEATGKENKMANILEGYAVFGRAILLGIWQSLFMFLWSLPSVIFIVFGAIIADKSDSGSTIAIIMIVISIIWIIFISIYKGAQYYFIYLNMAAHPELTAKQCFDATVEMTKGHVGSIIIAFLSFIGWSILNSFTFGILSFFYLTPYMNLTYTELYLQMSGGSGSSPSYAASYVDSSYTVGGDYNYGVKTQRMNQSANFQIIGIAGMYSGSSFNISSGQQISIGRDPAYSQIIISSGGESVSRRHCLIQVDSAAGLYFVTDYSSNGTYLDDGTRLTPNIACPVSPGSVIHLGNRNNSFKLQ